MKKNLLKSMLVATAMAFGATSAWADGVIPAGTYYVLNAAYDEPELLMAAGHNWGTRAIVDEQGLDLDFIYDESTDTYSIDSRVSNGGNSHFLGSGLYMDSPAFGWTIEGDFVYTIGAVFDGVKKYLAVDSNLEIVLTEDGTADNAQWAFIQKDYWENLQTEKGLESLKGATADQPADATFLIKSASFNRNNQRNGQVWNMIADNQNLGGGGSDGNGCAESYHSTFTLSQTLSNAPAGVYAMTAQGFYRQDGSDNENLPYFYANDEKQVFPVMANLPDHDNNNGNSMGDAAVEFTNGKYTIAPIVFEVTEDGQLTVGAALENNTNLWCIWDNFRLTYYGKETSVNAVKFAAKIAQLQELLNKVKELYANSDIQYTRSELQTIATLAPMYENMDPATVTEETLDLGIQVLSGAIDHAEAELIAANVLPQMEAFTKTTNFYTEDALNNYFTQWNEKYTAGTLTKAEANALQDPNVTTGWRANNNVDDLLMSVWDAVTMDWGTYHVNTWSVEGNQDGTNFVVPFIEYWVGDGDSLPEKVLTATIEGAEPKGIYDITGWIRVRIKNNVTDAPTGITLQVGDGQPVDVTTGAPVSGTQFYLDNFTVQGNADDSGKLVVKFNVAAENNISWLSFKNMNHSFNAQATGISEVNSVRTSNDAIYNMAGQRVEKAQKGLFIQNGKKVIVK